MPTWNARDLSRWRARTMGTFIFSSVTFFKLFGPFREPFASRTQKIHVLHAQFKREKFLLFPRGGVRVKSRWWFFKGNQTNRDPERGISVSRVFGKLWSTSSGGVGRAKHMGREWEQGTSELQSELTPDSSHAILRHAMYKRMHEPGNPQDLYSFTHQSFIPLRDYPRSTPGRA